MASVTLQTPAWYQDFPWFHLETGARFSAEQLHNIIYIICLAGDNPAMNLRGSLMLVESLTKSMVELQGFA